MNDNPVLTTIVVLFYILFSLYAQRRIYASVVLTRKRKRVNTILSWLIPFLWFLIIKDIIDYQSYTVTKKHRDRLHRQKYPTYYESKKGFIAK